MQIRLPILQPYLLLTSIPFFFDNEGGIWLDQLWHRDFVRHFDYIKDLVLVAPCIEKTVDHTGLILIVLPKGTRFSTIGLPQLESFARVLIKLPTLLMRLWKGIGEADIIHSGIVGWPIPIGWLANPMALLRGKKLILVVESAPWRASRGIRRSLINWLRGTMTESLGRFFVNRAGLVFFTQPSYKETLMTNGSGQGHVIAATWINEADALDEIEVKEVWRKKNTNDPNEVRYLFASRLTEQKGVHILISSLRLLDKTGVSLSVDVIGNGPLRQDCLDAIPTFTNIKFSVLDPVPYGQPFFDVVRRYHALIVATVSDEQPRIIFDANSQGVPIVAFETDGTRPFIKHSETGWLVTNGDASSLADQLQVCADHPDKFQFLGCNSLEFARANTHEQMHNKRWNLISKWLED